TTLSLFRHLLRAPSTPPLSPYTTLFRSKDSLDRMMPGRHSGGVTTRTASPISTSAPGVPMMPVMFILASCFSLQFGAALAVQLRSEEHTSELQSRFDLVCRLLLEKKKHT